MELVEPDRPRPKNPFGLINIVNKVVIELLLLSSIAMQAGRCVSIHMSKDACATFENSRDNLKMKLFLCDSNPIKSRNEEYQIVVGKVLS